MNKNKNSLFRVLLFIYLNDFTTNALLNLSSVYTHLYKKILYNFIYTLIMKKEIIYVKYTYEVQIDIVIF